MAFRTVKEIETSKLNLKFKIQCLHDWARTNNVGEWEENFINDIAGRMEEVQWDTSCLTKRQEDKIEELYERRIVRDSDATRRFHEHKKQ